MLYTCISMILMLRAILQTKIYSRSLCTQEIRYNFAVLQPISKFQSSVDFSLQVGSIYTQRERGTLTLPKFAVCPITKVRDVPETTKNAITHTHAMALLTCAYILCKRPQIFAKFNYNGCLCKLFSQQLYTPGCKVNANRL